MITNFKIFESDGYITWDSENKQAPENYKYQLGDFVKVKNPTYYKWLTHGYNNQTYCIVCLINTIPFNSDRYAVVPIESPDSSYEEWVTEDEIEPLDEDEKEEAETIISAQKYNL
jgi:hypothetical protein